MALKCLNANLAPSEHARGRFDREVRLAARLQHPHIGQVFESGVDRGVYYFAMELVDGTPLDHYVRDRALPPRDTIQLISAVCDAVQHAHERGVVHRDLKPGNILVTAAGSRRCSTSAWPRRWPRPPRTC